MMRRCACHKRPSTAPLFVQARGALKKGLLAHLRSGRTMRRARCASTQGQQRGQIKEAVSIRQKPKTVRYPVAEKETCSQDHATPT